ncbi:MAG: molybdopterin cofactor-binding domain-containing protein [Pseudomonadota bacterium]
MIDLAEPQAISRRKFLVGTGATGAGLSLGFSFSSAEADSNWAQKSATPEVNAWVVIDPDDSVRIRVVKSEMGQGTLTGLAQLVVEELECDWDNVSTEYPTPGESLARNEVWGSFLTAASFGIRKSQKMVREGGAAARIMLIGAAADRWGVPAGECSVEKGVITHANTGRTLSYGEVATDAGQRTPPTEVPLRDPKDWKIAGKPIKRLDTEAKLNGSQIYGVDIKLDGMLSASIKACPVWGGTLVSFNADAANQMPGVRKIVAIDGNAVAVIADTWWRANRALEAVEIEWDLGENANTSSSDIDNVLNEGLDATEAFVGNSVGDADAAIAEAAQVVTSTYDYPYQAHATMEPMNATAIWTPENCNVWAPTQNGQGAHAAAVEAAGLKPEQVDITKVHLGGGFGRRQSNDWLRQAVLIAKELPGTPVKLIYTREEDLTQSMYHPVTKARMTAGLDENGDITGLKMRISGQSISVFSLKFLIQDDGSDPLVFQAVAPEGDFQISYGFPAVHVDHAMRNPFVRPAVWRGVNINQNTIYMESFMDELAEAAGKDPLEFRRKLMSERPRHLAVLNAVAERGKWGSPSAPGRHQGLAVSFAFGSAIAALAEVSVTDGELTVHKITAATDPVRAVNPQQIEAQVEGSFAYGLSALLYQEITVADGRIEQDNFDSYPSMTISDMPEVETVIIESGGDVEWGGVGEPTIAVAAPAVLNAIYAATGKRIRSFPLSGISLSEV